MFNFMCIFLVVIVVNSAIFCEASTLEESFSKNEELIEQGRTFVHHAVKRFMIILPAIFFKLGIAFTLLLIVTLVAVNNGFIGFLLLVVGMSSVLARLQEARRPIPIVHSIQPTAAYHHNLAWERSDTDANKSNDFDKAINQNNYASVGYYSKYGSSTR